jgi:hypothetical protein
MYMSRRPALFAAALLAASAVGARPALAEGGGSLRGSRRSVDRMYDYAVDRDLRFLRTRTGARDAVGAGRLIPLPVSGPYVHYRVVGARYPYALPATNDFVRELAAAYRNGCGERLVVTSALRPKTEQPRNASPKSVHPTGMAVDFRKPTGKCLTWLRGALLAYERAGVIEAIEERRPPHFHVAVFGDRWARFTRGEAAPAAVPAPAELAAAPAATRSPAAKAARARPAVRTVAKASTRKVAKAPARKAAARRYTVRKGDSLWSIARRHGTTVARLRAANGLRSSAVRPGRRLTIPA